LAKQDTFCDHVADLLAPLGAVTYRYMFGGYGIYVDGRIVAIVDDGELYLKADDVNRPGFEALGMSPFQPFSDRDSTMPYYRVPDETLDNQDRLLELTRTSLAAADRGARRRQD